MYITYRAARNYKDPPPLGVQRQGPDNSTRNPPSGFFGAISWGRVRVTNGFLLLFKM